MSDRTALVTGASRGIGRATAIALASEGYDVAITARTVAEGTHADGLPGSLESTAIEIEKYGVRALSVPLDLLDRDALVPTIESVLERWGHLDVYVSNAIYVGPEQQNRFLDEQPGEIERRIFGNLTAQLLMTQRVARAMADRGSGTVIHITSGAGMSDPPAPVGEGGWAATYGCSKGGMHRLAGILALELGPAGVRFLNLEPGFVATERTKSKTEYDWIASRGNPPEVIGAVAAWMLRQPEDVVPNGTTVRGAKVAKSLGLR